MKNVLIALVLSLTALSACQQKSPEEENASLKKIEAVDFSHVKINDSFWSTILKKHVTATIPVCIDQIENQTGRIQNFENAAKKQGEHSGIYFDDSDVYKALEGIAYTLVNNPDPALEQKADEWIDKFAAAQEPDGYINTYYTLTGLENRWTNMNKHEMYCAGHMIEAAVAYYQATGKRKLLDVSEKMVQHMMSLFGPGKRHWVPGHEEIELALVKLYQVTGKQEYLDFSDWLLNERGHGYGSTGGNGEWNAGYYQDNIPVKEMSDISGHAVRSMYLYCGMADVAALKGDTAYIAALHRLWDDVVLRNMYITGGIGSSADNEGFTEDYDLPNLEAYCETCASVGMVFWNWRMNQFTGDTKYIDVLERSLYNGVLAGISAEGDRFFYVNPLESKGNHHRQAWYGCACCPSQVSRFIPSIGNYIYGLSKDAIWVNLFIGNEAVLPTSQGDIPVSIQTNMPWGGEVKVTINKDYNGEIRLRVPEWTTGYQLQVNGEEVKTSIDKGYTVLNRIWKEGDEISLKMAIDTKMVAANPRVKADEGKRAIMRGPLVFCAEEIDNKQSYDKMALNNNTQFTETYNANLLNGIEQIQVQTGNTSFSLIPYYAWDNREAGRMKVWLDYIN